jgi:hypothetical protein
MTETENITYGKFHFRGQTLIRSLFYNHRAFFTIIVTSPTECTIYFKKHYMVP